MPQLWNPYCRTWLRNSQQVLSKRGDQFSQPHHSLQRQIEQKRAKLAVGEVLEQAGPSNVKDLRSPLPIEAFTTPLDGILNLTTVPPGAVEQQVLLSNGPQGSPSQPSNAWLDSRASEMFLRTAQLQKGKKTLRLTLQTMFFLRTKNKHQQTVETPDQQYHMAKKSFNFAVGGWKYLHFL